MADEHRYDRIGRGYNDRRVPDPRIKAQIMAAVGDAPLVLNVGAGTGAYEPADRPVVAVEPSALMAASYQGSGRLVRALGDALPFAPGFPVAMALLTLHHWPDWRAGLDELFRVADRVVVFTHEPQLCDFWLLDYLPQIRELDLTIFAPLSEMAEFAQANARTMAVSPVLVPHDCSDGFLGGYWRRPAAYLEPDVRQAISSFHQLSAQTVSGFVKVLGDDLESGRWQQRYGHLLPLEHLDVGYRLLTFDRASASGA